MKVSPDEGLCHESLWWLALHGVSGMGPATFHKLLRVYGTPKNAIEEATEPKLRQLGKISPETIQGIVAARRPSRRRAVLKMAESLRRRGIGLLNLRDTGYPFLLKRIELPPPLLFCMGEFSELDRHSVAVIGSTTPSPEGESLAHEWGALLSHHGCTVVSGYALGIDSAAHAGALNAGGRSIFALPTGINRFALREGFPSIKELRDRAVVVSELLPDRRWTSAGALARNRITVGLSRVVLIVEAREQSGTLHTFRIACREGVPVFVLKRRHASTVAPGNEIALSEGGIPITSPDEVERILQCVFEQSDGVR